MGSPPASRFSGPPVHDRDPSPRGGRARLARRHRLRDSAVFGRVLRGGARVSDARLRVWVLPGNTEETRLGLIVTRRHGPAVARNRLKRLMREAYRLIRSEMPPQLDVLCSPHVGVVLTLDGCRESLRRLVAAAAAKLRRANPPTRN